MVATLIRSQRVDHLLQLPIKQRLVFLPPLRGNSGRSRYWNPGRGGLPQQSNLRRSQAALSTRSRVKASAARARG